MTLEYKQLEGRPIQAGGAHTPQSAAIAAAQFANGGMSGLNQMMHGLGSGLSSAMSRQQSMAGAGAGAPLTMPPSSLTTPVSSTATLPGQTSTIGNNASTPMAGFAVKPF